MGIIFLVSLFLLGLAHMAWSCPTNCSCSHIGRTVTCTNLDLMNIPPDLPEWARRLDLSHNRISRVNMKPLKALSGLRELLLHNNKIVDIESGAFSKLRQLMLLRLDNNRLTFLNGTQMAGLMFLRQLQLNANALRQVPLSLPSGLVSLRLDDNPFVCDCLSMQIQPLLRQAEDERFRAVCQEPNEVAKQSLIRISHLSFPSCKPLPSPASTSYAPIIASPPRSHQLTAGASVQWNCKARGHPKPYIAWMHQSKLITGAQRYAEIRRGGALLRIPEVDSPYAGVYVCVAANPLGRTEARVDLSIVASRPPVIRTKPVDQEAPAGGNVEFTCEAYGRPQPVIRWMRKLVFSQMLETDGKRYEVNGGVLRVRNVTKEDEEALFICSASSEYGAVQAGAQIRIRTRPRYDYRTDSAIIGGQDTLFNKAIEKARMEVSRAINATVTRLRDRSLSRSAIDVATLFRQPNEEAIQLSRAAEIYERAVEQVELILRRNQLNLTAGTGSQSGFITRLLSDEQLSIIARLSGCQRQTQENVDCSHQICFHNRYRAIDGVCNNMRKPKLGAALAPFHRLLPPQYENGVNEPIGWNINKLYGGFPKPSARLVSMRLLSSPAVTRSTKLSAMVMQWGQFLDHDLDFTPVDASNRRFSDGVTCNETCVNESPCFPIDMPPDDPRIRKRSCIGFARSSATCGSGATSLLLGQPHFREQINQITSFIDASNVYGSHQLEADELRELDYDEGKLRHGMPTASRQRLLPFNTRAPVDCQIDQTQLHVPCFLAGDHRANENLGLLAMHTLWFREHNRLVTRLRLYNPHWTGDRLYYEGRKIVGAMMQHITYTAWLPKILGPQGMQKLRRKYSGYDQNVDPSISNVFATAAFRFGHTLINPVLYRLNETFGEIPKGHLPLHKAFFAPHKLVDDGGIDPVLRGLLVAGMKMVNPKHPMNTELTEKLFKLAHEISLDLGALNIQRGRDHGLPGYSEWRRLCNLSVPNVFDDLRWEIPDPEIRERMRQVYGHPSNVDLFAGGVLEQPMSGSQIGPTFSCIIIDQFKRLRAGDRFWYENPTQFTPSQLHQIRRASLARVICDNSDNLTSIVRDPFALPGSIEEFFDCEKIPKMELGPWTDCRTSEDGENENSPFGRPPRRRRRRSAEEPKKMTRRLRSLQERVRHLEEKLESLYAKLSA